MIASDVRDVYERLRSFMAGYDIKIVTAQAGQLNRYRPVDLTITLAPNQPSLRAGLNVTILKSKPEVGDVVYVDYINMLGVDHG